MAVQTSEGRTRAGAAILSVHDLRVHYHTPRGAVRAVDGVTFDIKAGERHWHGAKADSPLSHITVTAAGSQSKHNH